MPSSNFSSFLAFIALTNFLLTSNLPTCQLSCDQPGAIGDLHHLLIECSALSSRHDVLFYYWDAICLNNPTLSSGVTNFKLGPQDVFLQFILDCSVLPEICELVRLQGESILAVMFKITRTFCYSIHRERLKLLNIWRP